MALLFINCNKKINSPNFYRSIGRSIDAQITLRLLGFVFIFASNIYISIPLDLGSTRVLPKNYANEIVLAFKPYLVCRFMKNIKRNLFPMSLCMCLCLFVCLCVTKCLRSRKLFLFFFFLNWFIKCMRCRKNEMKNNRLIYT